MTKKMDDHHEAEGFEPLTDEERSALKSKIKNDSTDPILNDIVDKAFLTEGNTTESDEMQKTTPNIKDKQEPLRSKRQSEIQHDQNQEQRKNQAQIAPEVRNERLRTILNYALKLLKKTSIRYVVLIIVAILLGLFLGWLLVPTPPPVII